MNYVYKSVFAPEIIGYLHLLSEAERYIDRDVSTLRHIDKYLVSIGATQKSLSADMVTDWLNTRDVSTQTKISDVIRLRGFAIEYLSWLEMERGCSTSTRNHRRTTIVSFANYALKRNFKEAMPFHK